MTITPEQHAQIADYVLGISEGPERQAFELRMASDPELARTVASFEDRLGALDDTVEPAEVPPGLWTNIEQAVVSARQQTPANQNGSSNFMTLLKPAALAASLAVAVGIGFAGGAFLQPGAPPPLVVAVLLSDDMEPGAIVEAFADDSVRIVPLEALIAPPENILEVWTLPDAETGPVSLGTFQEARDLVLGGPDLPPPQPNQLYEITLEPAGGSPTGRPTGPILLKGYARAPVI